MESRAESQLDWIDTSIDAVTTILDRMAESS
jgi:hypothetical protein